MRDYLPLTICHLSFISRFSFNKFVAELFDKWKVTIVKLLANGKWLMANSSAGENV